ncbi:MULTISPECIES: TolC family protein [unclassified Arcicella]|uniref:TolC family protein n=1 Tax=unclassified Arcicella TaxID=2644986 RepID=UPI00285ECD71|nr:MULTISPECIES: TolC family protein [unclassified Arcicella]MDR6562389.1 NodT family efflux transporter outer membrane factor (OMF) lipoprotein [Arcicella sp. BE51]MDR6812283.1 NodT family efflux transporter outer membrane factor (OMF) lipoprotein [Arcicella sp. BE140]
MKLSKIHISLSVIISLLLSSCMIEKKYSRANLNIPEQYRETVTVTADTIQLHWRTFFKDTILVSLIEKALLKNNEIVVAVMNMQQLDLMYKQSKLGLYPSVDLNVGANRNWLSKSSLNGSLTEQFLGTSYMDDYAASLRLSWEADIWGKAKMYREASLANYFAQKENLSALKTRLIVQVAQAYYNLIALDEQLKVAKRNIILGDSTLAMIRLQYKSGQVNSLAVEQIEAQKKTAELLVPLALQNIAIQENALNILCGEYPSSKVRVDIIDNVMPSSIFPLGVPAMLLSRRPDVKAAEYAVVSANAKRNLANLAMYPSISFTPSVGMNSFKLDTWFNLPGSIVKNIGVNLAQPIFMKKSLKTAYDIAILDQEKAVSTFKQSLLTAVGEVSDALARAKYADERMDLVKQKKASLTKASNDVFMLYKSGMATYLEVITTQNNSLQNELEVIEIKKEKFNAITDLYRTLGGGEK